MKINQPTKGSAVVRISLELDERLSAMAEQTGRSKAYYMKRALTRFLDDTEDYYIALAAKEEAHEKGTTTLDALKRELGLDSGTDAKRPAAVKKPGAGRARPVDRADRKKAVAHATSVR